MANFFQNINKSLARLILFLLLFVYAPYFANAQDIHFSQFTASPLTLNPALTGLFNGDYRLTGIYRNQWASVTTPYETYSFSLDFALLREKLNNDILGAGIVFYRDKAGDTELTTSYYGLSVAYYKSLTEHHFLSGGIQGGIIQRNIDYSKITTGSQFNGDVFDPGLTTDESFSTENFSSFDISGGLMWFYNIDNENNIYVGLALPHANKPKLTFNDNADKLYRKLVVHSGGQLIITKTWYLLPDAVLYRKGSNTELNFGSYLKYQLKKQKPTIHQTAFYFGTWYRTKDAIIMAIRVDYKGVNLGFSYDFNISELTAASSGKGGPEISFSYINTIPPGKVYEQRLNCPRF